MKRHRRGGGTHFTSSSSSSSFTTPSSISSPVSISTISIAAAAALVLCSQVSIVSGCGYHSTETDSKCDDTDLNSSNCIYEDSVQFTVTPPATPPPSPVNMATDKDDKDDDDDNNNDFMKLPEGLNLISLSLSDNEEYSSVSYDGDQEDNSSTTYSSASNSNPRRTKNKDQSTHNSSNNQNPSSSSSVLKPKAKFGAFISDAVKMSKLCFSTTFLNEGGLDDIGSTENYDNCDNYDDPASTIPVHSETNRSHSAVDPSFHEEFEDHLSTSFFSIENPLTSSNSNSSPRKRSMSSHTPSIISPDPARISSSCLKTCESILSISMSNDDTSTVFKCLTESEDKLSTNNNGNNQDDNDDNNDENTGNNLQSELPRFVSDREKEVIALPPVFLFNLTPDSPVYHVTDEETSKILRLTKFQYFNLIESYTHESIHTLCENFGIFLYKNLIDTAKASGIDKICNCNDSSKSEHLPLKMFNQLSFVLWITTEKLLLVSKAKIEQSELETGNYSEDHGSGSDTDTNSASAHLLDIEPKDYVKCSLEMLVFECILSTIDMDFFHQLQVQDPHLPEYDYFELLRLVREALLTFALLNNHFDESFLKNEKVMSVFKIIIIEADNRLHEETIDIIRQLYDCVHLKELQTRFNIKEMKILAQVKDDRSRLIYENLLKKKSKGSIRKKHKSNQKQNQKQKPPVLRLNTLPTQFLGFIWQYRAYILIAVLLAVLIQVFFIS